MRRFLISGRADLRVCRIDGPPGAETRLWAVEELVGGGGGGAGCNAADEQLGGVVEGGVVRGDAFAETCLPSGEVSGLGECRFQE